MEKGKGQLWFPIDSLLKIMEQYEKSGKQLYEREKSVDIRDILYKKKEKK